MNKPTLFERVRGETGYNQYKYPDKLDFNNEPFATVIPVRTPNFKVHRSDGLANSALGHHMQGAKYQQIDGEWVKVWEFYDPTNCETCNAALTDGDLAATRMYYRGDKHLRSPLHKGSAILAPFLCRICFDAEEEIIGDKKKAREFAQEQKRRKEFDAKHNTRK